jgi:hypothetical protein
MSSVSFRFLGNLMRKGVPVWALENEELCPKLPYS